LAANGFSSWPCRCGIKHKPAPWCSHAIDDASVGSASCVPSWRLTVDDAHHACSQVGNSAANLLTKSRPVRFPATMQHRVAAHNARPVVGRARSGSPVDDLRTSGWLAKPVVVEAQVAPPLSCIQGLVGPPAWGSEIAVGVVRCREPSGPRLARIRSENIRRNGNGVRVCGNRQFGGGGAQFWLTKTTPGCGCT
jgi:hypothetical protein